jgi:hypothetical protein
MTLIGTVADGYGRKVGTAMNLRSLLKAGIPVLIVGVAIAAVSGSRRPDDAMVDLRKLTPFEVTDAGFTLEAEQDLSVEAVGAPRADYWAGNAWILNAQTREVVWELRVSNPEHSRRGLAKFEGTVRLPAGDYLVKYAMFARPDDVRSWLTRALGGLGFGEDFRITIQGPGTPLSDAEVDQVDRSFADNAFVSFTGLDDDSQERIGFSVSQPTEVEVYAIGEVMDGEAYDYGWLMNTETGEVLWKLDADGSQPAGGAEKNRMARTVFSLDPGSYAAYAVTDGSHDASNWNSAPPLDPEYWGLTIRATSDDADIQVYAYRPAPLANAFVSLIGLGDDEAVSAGFTLTQPMAVRVRALGEGMGDQMYDYGWILDAESHRPVWKMEYGNTESAGGADKNRLADEIVPLEAGDYLVYYVTDGSHSFEDWNASPPMDQDRWGITLLPAADGPAGNAVRPLDPASDRRRIAALLGIRDDDQRSESFTLADGTDVRVYALGEGSDGDMYDYAWIENAGTGRTVWQMEYRDTEHAGGATKNRVFDAVITLPAGEYTLRYTSDGSHSSEDWNSGAPYDPFNYGVTITRTENIER